MKNISLKFVYKEIEHVLSFDVEASDHWVSKTVNGILFDVHYCEDYDEICVYDSVNNQTEFNSHIIYSRKISEIMQEVRVVMTFECSLALLRDDIYDSLVNKNISQFHNGHPINLMCINKIDEEEQLYKESKTSEADDKFLTEYMLRCFYRETFNLAGTYFLSDYLINEIDGYVDEEEFKIIKSLYDLITNKCLSLGIDMHQISSEEAIDWKFKGKSWDNLPWENLPST